LKLKKLGMRTVKTGISVGLSLLCQGILVQNPVYTALACLVSVQESVKDSLLTGLYRIRGTIIGGIVGYLFALICTGNPIISALGIIATIYICNQFDLKSEISIACVTFIAIHLGNIADTTLVEYSVGRIIDTSVGVIIGVVVNYTLARPKHSINIHADLLKVEQAVSKYIEDKIIKKSDKCSLDLLEDAIHDLEKDYKIFKNEFTHMQESECSDDTSNLDNLALLSSELYFHIHSLEMLSSKQWLNPNNAKKLQYLYEKDKLKWEIDETKSPVFNYHLRKILKQINLLRIGIDNQFGSNINN
jgi:uncharacterized membrane protein YgaE (UPF0421/DUF939 family)